MTTHLFIMRSCLWVSLDSNRSLSRTSAGVSVGLYSKPLAYKACSITGPHQQYFGVNLPISKTIREKLDPKKTFQKPWGCSSEALPTSRIPSCKTIHGKPTEVSASPCGGRPWRPLWTWESCREWSSRDLAGEVWRYYQQTLSWLNRFCWLVGWLVWLKVGFVAFCWSVDDFFRWLTLIFVGVEWLETNFFNKDSDIPTLFGEKKCGWQRLTPSPLKYSLSNFCRTLPFKGGGKPKRGLGRLPQLPKFSNPTVGKKFL